MEDEAFTRDGLVASIDWPSFGISQIRVACDGADGYEKLKEFLPDILLADIRMPQMTGLELADRASKLLPECQVIFMSGFSDKEYLMNAIKLSSVDYIEKPLDLGELGEAIRKAVRRVDSMRQNSFNAEEMAKNAKRNLAFELTLSQKICLPPGIDTRCANSRLFFTVVLASPHILERHMELAEHALGEKDFFFLCAMGENKIIIHMPFMERPALFKVLNGIMPGLPEDTVTAAGKKVAGLANVRESYQSALLAMEKRFYHPNRNIFFSDRTEHVDLSSNILRKFVDLVLEDRNEAEKYLEELMNLLRYKDSTPVVMLKYSCYWICRELHAAAPDKFRRTVSKDMDSAAMLIDEAKSLGELRSLLLQCIETYSPDKSREAEVSGLIRGVKKTVDSGYMNKELSVASLAEQFYISPAHLCVVFKNETGITVKAYIMDKRLEKARHLLQYTRHRIFDVAELCGFGSGNYFAKSFKQHTGVSPQEYRSRYGVL